MARSFHRRWISNRESKGLRHPGWIGGAAMGRQRGGSSAGMARPYRGAHAADAIRLSVRGDCQPKAVLMEKKPKVVVVMPAYNAAKTLHMTYADLPHQIVDLVILVDDGSKDETARIAKELGLELFVHNGNYGYGANQKTCYREALKAGADIVVMVHPDYQYDPTLLPQIVAPIERGEADIVFGSRLLGANPMKQGMPWWKYISNRFLTWVENKAFGLHLSEFHTGYRAYTHDALHSMNLATNSDKFIFDQEVVAQAVALNLRITEIAVPTRYFPQASSASFMQSSIYGLSILYLVFRYRLHKSGIR